MSKEKPEKNPSKEKKSSSKDLGKPSSLETKKSYFDSDVKSQHPDFSSVSSSVKSHENRTDDHVKVLSDTEKNDKPSKEATSSSQNLSQNENIKSKTKHLNESSSKKLSSRMLILIVSIGSVIALQGYAIYTLLDKVSSLEVISVQAKHLENTLNQLDGKLAALEKDAALKIKTLQDSLHGTVAQHVEKQTSQLQSSPLTQDQFEKYSLGDNQLEFIKDHLVKAIEDKLNRKDETFKASQALTYFTYLRQAVLEGKPYVKHLDHMKDILQSDLDISRTLTTAFDVLSMYASSGVSPFKNLYKFPEEVLSIDEEFPKIFAWIKDYVSFKASTPKGLSLQDKDRLMRFLDSQQIKNAFDLVAQHVSQNVAMKAAWSSWIKVCEVRLNVMKCLDDIETFLFEKVLP